MRAASPHSEGGDPRGQTSEAEAAGEGSVALPSGTEAVAAVEPAVPTLLLPEPEPDLDDAEDVRPPSPPALAHSSTSMSVPTLPPLRGTAPPGSLSSRIKARTRTLSVSAARPSPTPPQPALPDEVGAAHARERLHEILACSPTPDESPLAKRGLSWERDALPSVLALSLSELRASLANPLSLMLSIAEDARSRRTPTPEPDEDGGGVGSYIGAVLAAQMSASSKKATAAAADDEQDEQKVASAVKIQARVRGNRDRMQVQRRQAEIREALRHKQAEQRRRLQERHEAAHEQDSAWVQKHGGGRTLEGERLELEARKQEGVDTMQQLKAEHDAEQQQQRDALADRRSQAELRLRQRQELRRRRNAGMGGQRRCCRGVKVAPELNDEAGSQGGDAERLSPTVATNQRATSGGGVDRRSTPRDEAGASRQEEDRGPHWRARVTREAFASYFQMISPGPLKRTVKEAEKAGAGVGGARELARAQALLRRGRMLLAASVGYICTVFSMSVLVLLAPGAASAVTAWAVVAVACVAWTLLFRGDTLPRQILPVGHFLWCYCLALFLVPATVMANMSGRMRVVGGYAFLFVLWMTGWGFMWVQLYGGNASAMAKVPSNDIMGLMVALPAGLMMKIKLWTVGYEGFTYSGFSFFPALPWDSVKVPPWSPSPADIFLAGIFQFEGCDDDGDDQARQGSCFAHYFSFFGAVAFVPLAYLLLYCVRNNTGRFMLVVEIAFAALTFPAIKQFTDVFSCTSGTISRVSKGNLTRVCDPNVLPSQTCMDVEPSIVCWEHDHFVHVVCVMLVLVPYYVGSLFLRTDSQAKSSAVIIDGAFSVVAVSLKMVLAVVASGFGDCHPLIIVCTVELVVVVIGLMSINRLTGRRFSNVVSLNVVRAVGMVAAAGNGMYGMYITSQHGVDVCASTDSTFNQFGRDARRPRGATWVEAGNGTAGYWNTTGLDNRKVASYTEFIALIVLNGGAIIFGIVYFKIKRRTLRQVKVDTRERCKRDDPTFFDKQVDYPLVLFRLESETEKAFKLWVSEERDDFDTARGM
eukprot:COSAG01_NODE_1415_length_10390_cov_2.905549_1_plen_1041_part_10